MELSELNTTARLMFEQREKIANLKKELAAEDAVLEGYEEEFKKVMEFANLKTFKSAYGTITVVEKRSVKTPKTAEDRCVFFDYLKSKGVFEDLATVHSATLNAWYNQEELKAAENGVFDFSIPGLNDVSSYKDVSYYKTRG